MTIPSYPELMLPILELIQDQKEWKLSIIIDNLIKEFPLTEEERELRTRECVEDEGIHVPRGLDHRAHAVAQVHRDAPVPGRSGREQDEQDSDGYQ